MADERRRDSARWRSRFLRAFLVSDGTARPSEVLLLIMGNVRRIAACVVGAGTIACYANSSRQEAQTIERYSLVRVAFTAPPVGFGDAADERAQYWLLGSELTIRETEMEIRDSIRPRMLERWPCAVLSEYRGRRRAGGYQAPTQPESLHVESVAIRDTTCDHLRIELETHVARLTRHGDSLRVSLVDAEASRQTAWEGHLNGDTLSLVRPPPWSVPRDYRGIAQWLFVRRSTPSTK